MKTRRFWTKELKSGCPHGVFCASSVPSEYLFLCLRRTFGFNIVALIHKTPYVEIYQYYCRRPDEQVPRHYNTVVRLCQFFCCGGKVNFVQIPYSHDRFSKISRTFFVKKMIPYKTYVPEDKLFLALYGSTTIQSLLFLKNIKNFVWFPKQYLLGF